MRTRTHGALSSFFFFFASLGKMDWLVSIQTTAQRYAGSAEFLYALGAVIVCGVVIMVLSKSVLVVLGLLLLAAAAATGWWLAHKGHGEPPVQLSSAPSPRVSARSAARTTVATDASTQPVADPAHGTDTKRWHVSIPASDPAYADLIQSIRTIQDQRRDPRSFMGGYHVVHPPLEACNAFQRTAISNPSNHLRASAQERRTALPAPAAAMEPTTRVLHRYAQASLAARRRAVPPSYQPI